VQICWSLLLIIKGVDLELCVAKLTAGILTKNYQLFVQENTRKWRLLRELKWRRRKLYFLLYWPRSIRWPKVVVDVKNQSEIQK
jgi:hypothetical protein